MSLQNFLYAADEEHMPVSAKLIRQSINDGTYYGKYRKRDSSISRIYDIRLVKEQDGTGVSIVCDDGMEYRFAVLDDNISRCDTPEKLVQAITKYDRQHTPDKTLKYAGTRGVPYYRSASKALTYIRELEERYDADIAIGRAMEFDEYQLRRRWNNYKRNVYLPFSVAEKMASDASVSKRYKESIEKLELCPEREEKDTKSMILKTVGLQILENGDENFWHYEWRKEAVRVTTVEFVLPSDGEKYVDLYLVDKEEDARSFVPFDLESGRTFFIGRFEEVFNKNPGFILTQNSLYMVIDKQIEWKYNEIGAIYEPWQPYILLHKSGEQGGIYRMVINDYFLDKYIGLKLHGKMWKPRVHDKLG